MTIDSNPLNAGHLEQLREGIRSAEQAIRQAELAKQAGLPVDAQLKTATANRDQLLKIKQTYFPGQ